MKRCDIKYRGLYEGEFVYGNLIKDNLIKENGEIDYHYSIAPPNFYTEIEGEPGKYEFSNNEDTYFEDIPFYSIGMYTGLKDKNEVEIYEGDRVRCSGIKGYIEFEDFAFKFKYLDFDGEEDWMYLVDTPELFEVYGNIHQN